MQIRYIVGIAVATAVLTTLVFLPRLVASKTKIEVVTVEVPQPKLSPAQIIWLARLMQCESGLKSSAVNPNDLDNTPSYGILQFKPSTFAHYATLYGIQGQLMESEAQVAIAEQWLLKGAVRWSGQFPGCVEKIGEPPRAHNSN